MSYIIKMSSSRRMPYYLNTETGQSTWDAPPELSLQQRLALPGAKEYLDLSGNPKEPPGQPGQVRASHLLVKHSGSRRPSSWKQEHITRSKADAIEILKSYSAQINGSAETFGQLAAVNSDCSSHAKNGDLGWFGKGQMQRPFEEATYALKVGQISEVVESDSGVHLILRTG